MILALILLPALLVLPALAALGVHYIDSPRRRVRTGRPLSTFGPDGRNSLAPDVKCALCERRGLNTVVRNRWLRDMPVCGGCLADANPGPEYSEAVDVIDLARRRAMRGAPELRSQLTEEDFKPDAPTKKPPPRSDDEILRDALSMGWREGALSDEEHERLVKMYLPPARKEKP